MRVCIVFAGEEDDYYRKLFTNMDAAILYAWNTAFTTRCDSIIEKWQLKNGNSTKLGHYKTRFEDFNRTYISEVIEGAKKELNTNKLPIILQKYGMYYENN
jgi:hypothetical protein